MSDAVCRETLPYPMPPEEGAGVKLELERRKRSLDCMCD
jgi:hypothetical protein